MLDQGRGQMLQPSSQPQDTLESASNLEKLQTSRSQPWGT